MDKAEQGPGGAAVNVIAYQGVTLWLARHSK
jgi:hypothetical protein